MVLRGIMIRFFCIVFVALSASLAQAADSLSAIYAGHWRGVGIQNSGSDWLIELEIAAAGARVEYPEIPCGGKWEYGADLGNTLWATERLDYGLEYCINGSFLTITPMPNQQLVALWHDKFGEEIAMAILHRDDSSLNDRQAEHFRTAISAFTGSFRQRARPACAPPPTI